MKKFSLIASMLTGVFISAALLAAPPSAPTGLCLQTLDDTQCAADNTSSDQTGVFPGTNLKLYPGFVIDTASTNPSPSSLESRWQELFTASPNRKASYRPAGVYGGLIYRVDWRNFYDNQGVRPKSPENPADPAYDWSKLDAIFNINAVQNEGAKIVLDIRHNEGYPSWIAGSPYDGIFNRGTAAAFRPSLKYYRYTGPDILGRTKIGASPSIVDEVVYFHQALRSHLIASGNIDKVMYVRMEEIAVNGSDLPDDFDQTNFFNGAGLTVSKVGGEWAKSHIYTVMTSLTGGSAKLNVLWQYMDTNHLGIAFPDMKMSGTNDISGSNRFTNLDGADQKDIRFLAQSTEGNGQRETTYFAAGIPNPWGYSNVTVPQTASHILWALSGAPKGKNKDSGLGQPGVDPAGIMPVHNVVLMWNISSHPNSPTIEEIHQAIDTFGPPGTYAFPYLPPGYKP